MARFVDVETPYSPGEKGMLEQNLLFARACVGDCFMRGEVPFASHLFFTQPGILDDDVPEERERGILAGKDLIEALPGVTTVVYTKLGVSSGMRYGIQRAKEAGRKTEYMELEEGWEEEERQLAKKHSHAKAWGFNG